MTTDFRLTPVYYPATFLRRRSLSRLAYLFGTLRLLQPPGLPQPREGLGRVVEVLALNLPPEKRRLIEAVLADYLRWGADHQGASYTLYVHQRREAREETLQQVKSSLKGGPAEEGGVRLPEDLTWQVFLRLAHDYDRQQEEIEELLERVKGMERQLGELTGLALEEADTGPAEFAGVGEEPETPSVAEELTTGGRVVACARLWLAANATGTPLTESPASHEFVLERAARFFGLSAQDIVEFHFELPDAARLGLDKALGLRESAFGPLEGVLARLSALGALLRARAWSEDVRASVDLLILELAEAAQRVCREAKQPRERLTLQGAVIPGASPERLFGRLANHEAGDEESGLYLLVEGGR